MIGHVGLTILGLDAVLMALIILRLYTLLGERLNDHEERIRSLETARAKGPFNPTVSIEPELLERVIDSNSAIAPSEASAPPQVSADTSQDKDTPA